MYVWVFKEAMIKVLAIGNSFSRDALYYLSGIGAADGVNIKAVNLYIPACSLERHWNNIVEDRPDYIYEENGYTTEKRISVRQALESNDWDYVVTQQSSGKAGQIETYFPYLERITGYVKDNTRSAELLLHQTWAFEKDFREKVFKVYDYDQANMFNCLVQAYRTAAERLNLRLIPCGEIVQEIRAVEPFIYEAGGRSLCRDGRHMDYLYGRYLLGAVWYRFLTGNCLSSNSFIPRRSSLPEERCDEEILRLIRRKVDELCET